MGKELNLELIAKECGVPDVSDTNTVIANIQALDEVYEKENLVKIYNYINRKIPKKQSVCFRTGNTRLYFAFI